MTSISDRLKALGVQIGASHISPPESPSRISLENILNGQPIANNFGETFVVEAYYGPDYRHGIELLRPAEHLTRLSEWVGDQRIIGLPSSDFVFLDTETTGLSGGTGTYAFLIGVGRYRAGGFHLAQYFMRDPTEEPAQLYALEEFIGSSEALVTYNGKAFDIPLLTTRYITHGWQSPFSNHIHLDLLHIARRLWRDRLPSRTLGNIEFRILGASRTEQDVPGWMIPQMYFDYLRSGDASPLRSVFYHNAMDILSLAALFSFLSEMLDDSTDTTRYHAIDLIALGKLFEDLGDLDRAVELYMAGLDLELPESAFLEAVTHLAFIHKKQDNAEQALPLWKIAASHRHIESHIELAKLFEHRLRDYREALYWTQTAIELVQSSPYQAYEINRWLASLEHRKRRLLHKDGQQG